MEINATPIMSAKATYLKMVRIISRATDKDLENYSNNRQRFNMIFQKSHQKNA